MNNNHIKATLLELPEGSAILFINTRKPDNNEHTKHRRKRASTKRA